MGFCYERLMNVRCPDCVDGDACDDCQAITDGVNEIDRLRTALAAAVAGRGKAEGMLADACVALDAVLAERDRLQIVRNECVASEAALIAERDAARAAYDALVQIAATHQMFREQAETKVERLQADLWAVASQGG